MTGSSAGAPRTRTTEDRVSLSFDDGPDPSWTPRVLEALARARARATFFVSTPAVRRKPRLLADIVAAGHEVGFHCERHVRHSERSRDAVAGETSAALDQLSALGASPRLWRTPWGQVAPWSAALAAELGLELCNWSDDTHDWRGDSTATMLSKLDSYLGGGSIVLLHDGIGPGAQRSGCDQTVQLIEPLAELARGRGLLLEPIAAPVQPSPPRVASSVVEGRAEIVTAAERPGSPRTECVDLGEALHVIAEGAEGLDREPRFPSEAFTRLAAEGALGFSVPGPDGERPSHRAEWALVRAVAAADSSVGRILDGHLNAVERIAAAAPASLRARELAAVRGGRRLLGLWGADPAAGEGDPATLREVDGELILGGAKTFCSGAGGVDAALVVARTGEPGPPALVLVACDTTVEIDRSWFRPGGLRASESHLVRFRSTPVLAVLGDPGELSREPLFSLDAIRTAASWAGMADTAATAALKELAGNPKRVEEQISNLAAGRIAAASSSIDAWFARAASAAAGPVDEIGALSIELRAEVDRAAKTIIDEAARACGSRPFARGGALDRSRRDLELFTLQHRLDPLLARRGRDLLESHR